jgi:GntR family transcriptional regulator/MocR family aminotransferase
MDYILERIKTSVSKSIISKKGSKSLYLLIYDSIQHDIIQNEIPEDVYLPATRILAAALDVSRSTLIKSYELLRLQGYIDSKKGSGHKVRALLKKENLQDVKNKNENKYPDLSVLSESFMSNVTLINSTNDKSVAFRPGLPPLDVFPVNQWKNLSNTYWRQVKSSSLSYSPSSGIDQLKRNISNYLNLIRGLKCDPNQIIIVSGSLQSLYLSGTALLNKDDVVAMENPTFPNVYSTFKGLGAQVKGISVDQEGMRVENLKGVKAKLIHVTPSCHYPSSVKMSMPRKRALLEFANQTGAYIIENDYEHEITNWKNKSDSLFDLDTENRVIYLGTFNRLLHPSLRIGYMILPPTLYGAVNAIMQHSHRFVSPSTQIVLNQFIEKKYIYYHIKNLINAVEERKHTFAASFKEAFGNKIKLEPHQNNHLQFLAHLDSKFSDKVLTAMFAKQNIVAHRYSKCYIANIEEPSSTLSQQGLILGFASVRQQYIKRKITQMEKASKNYLGK